MTPERKALETIKEEILGWKKRDCRRISIEEIENWIGDVADKLTNPRRKTF